MKTARQALTEARDLLAIPGNWAKGQFAVDPADPHNMDASPTDPKACHWCSLGALYKVEGFNPFDSRSAGGDALLASVSALHTALIATHPECDDVPAFNDDCDTNLPDVLALFDTAIASCPAEAA